MSPADPPRQPELRVHRALSSPARGRLVEVLRQEPELDAATLARRLGLHVNTVRSHLAVLAEAGLVETVVEARDRPGRPRLLYRLPAPTAEQTTAADDRGYRFLAKVLASYLGTVVPDRSTAAEQAGAAWGRFLVTKPPPFTSLDAAGAIQQLVALLHEFGFEPTLDDSDRGAPRVVLHRCPFLQVAREHQEVVCSVHLGLMRGALAELGVDVVADALIPWADADTCVTHLRVGAE